MNYPYSYKNGNCDISIYDNGTRIITCEDNILKPLTPFNIDIKVSSSCSFGFNEKTKTSFCYFCHESATTNGKECDYDKLKILLQDIPKGTELAIGSNNLTKELLNFIEWAYSVDLIVNLTVNQGHLRRDINNIEYCIEKGIIKGLGVSYRGSLKWDIPQIILNYEHTIFHLICGIDDFNTINELHNLGVKKILILGEKDFGFNESKVDLNSLSHKQWFWWVGKLFDNYEIVAFDNLALEQLKIRRFFNNDGWNLFNNEEHSIYINAVDEYYSPSSRSNIKIDCNKITLKEFFNGK